MARLITKFKYLKPEDRKNVGGYAEYIATREGVEKIDESRKFAPATDKQRRLIQKILSDFPDSKSSLEYEDYLKDKTVGAASEFITRALEENADEMMHTKTYADYIATRPPCGTLRLSRTLYRRRRGGGSEKGVGRAQRSHGKCVDGNRLTAP